MDVMEYFINRWMTDDMNTSVWLTACSIASSPNVAYRVASGKFSLKHACAAIIHSALVSANIVMFSLIFNPDSNRPKCIITHITVKLTQ